VASLSQGRTAAAQCGLFTHKSVPVIFEPPCISKCECDHEKFLLHNYQYYVYLRKGAVRWIFNGNQANDMCLE